MLLNSLISITNRNRACRTPGVADFIGFYWLLLAFITGFKNYTCAFDCLLGKTDIIQPFVECSPKFNVKSFFFTNKKEKKNEANSFHRQWQPTLFLFPVMIMWVLTRFRSAHFEQIFVYQNV